MKKLMNKEIRITSVELVEVINEFRKLEVILPAKNTLNYFIKIL